MIRVQLIHFFLPFWPISGWALGLAQNSASHPAAQINDTGHPGEQLSKLLGFVAREVHHNRDGREEADDPRHVQQRMFLALLAERLARQANGLLAPGRGWGEGDEAGRRELKFTYLEM